LEGRGRRRGRPFVDSANQCSTSGFSAGCDAVIIFLGNNYGKDQAVYETWLHQMVIRLAPMPTVLINTSLFDPAQQQVTTPSPTSPPLTRT